MLGKYLAIPSTFLFLWYKSILLHLFSTKQHLGRCLYFVEGVKNWGRGEAIF